MTVGHLHVEDASRWRFRLQGVTSCDLWYQRLDAELPEVISLDAPLVGSVLYWMRQPVNQVRVHGAVSRALLRNLDELQHVWALWRPDAYSRVEFSPDDVFEDTRVGEGAVAAFSGGVDSSFTVYRHAIAQPGPHTLPLREVVMVQGFDILLDEDEVFTRAVGRSERMLTATDLPVARVRTNVKRDLGQTWEDAFGLCVASVLLTFQGTRQYGLIGSGSNPYNDLVLPWGSTPVQDWMASTGSMEIRHDGAGYSRNDKVRALAGWPDLLRELRVCWKGADHDRNCGRCEKCIRTILNFKATGQPVPSCFDRDVTEDEIRQLHLPNRAVFAAFVSVVVAAEQHNIQAPWVNATRSMLRANRLRSSLPGRAVQRARRFVRSNRR